MVGWRGGVVAWWRGGVERTWDQAVVVQPAWHHRLDVFLLWISTHTSCHGTYTQTHTHTHTHTHRYTYTQ